MRCPKCTQNIVLQKGDYTKENFWQHSFDCTNCSLRLVNNIKGELLRLIGFIILIFGVLTFGGSWPIPLLLPEQSASVSALGIFLLFVGQKIATVASIYESS